jgi:hypothetical protein
MILSFRKGKIERMKNYGGMLAQNELTLSTRAMAISILSSIADSFPGAFPLAIGENIPPTASEYSRSSDDDDDDNDDDEDGVDADAYHDEDDGPPLLPSSCTDHADADHAILLSRPPSDGSAYIPPSSPDRVDDVDVRAPSPPSSSSTSIAASFEYELLASLASTIDGISPPPPASGGASMPSKTTSSTISSLFPDEDEDDDDDDDDDDDANVEANDLSLSTTSRIVSPSNTRSGSQNRVVLRPIATDAGGVVGRG